jgi:hypothetical protein
MEERGHGQGQRRERMSSVIERVDQLVLEYVSRAADAAHGVLPPRQRIDFIGKLRKRIDAERTGMEDPAAVAKVLARFGDPVELVRREVRRLGGETASRRPAEALEETGRPTGVIVPAPTSGLHDSSEPLSGRPAFEDSAEPDSATGFTETGSVSGYAASERGPSGGTGSGSSDTAGASASGPSGEAGSESPDSRESATGTPRRSHPYGAVPGGSVPVTAQDPGVRASGSSAVYEAAHKADPANVSVPPPADAPDAAGRPRSSSMTPGGGEPDDRAA